MARSRPRTPPPVDLLSLASSVGAKPKTLADNLRRQRFLNATPEERKAGAERRMPLYDALQPLERRVLQEMGSDTPFLTWVRNNYLVLALEPALFERCIKARLKELQRSYEVHVIAKGGDWDTAYGIPPCQPTPHDYLSILNC